MANRSSKSQGSRSGKGSPSSMSKSSEQMSPGSDSEICPTPSEPRRDTSISSDDEEEE